MSRISKMSKSEALEYLIKVSKVQEKILNKLAQNVDPKADLKKMINRMYAMYTTALLNPSNAGFAAEILRELDNSARSIGLSIAKPFNENNKTRAIRCIYLSAKLDFDVDEKIIQFLKKNPNNFKLPSQKFAIEKLNKSIELNSDNIDLFFYLSSSYLYLIFSFDSNRSFIYYIIIYIHELN